MVELDDVLNIEGEAESEEDYFVSMQKMINSGMWSMPGRNGRAMMTAIEAGRCLLGRSDFRDYYGNRIPSRDQVQAGTKGSRQYVVDHCGEDWARLVDEL